MPCGNTSNPAPKLFTNLPDESNLRTGSRSDPSQLKGTPGCIWDAGTKPCAPQRSSTHTLDPSGSISTALVDPQMRPGGSFPHPSIQRTGLGPPFVVITAH